MTADRKALPEFVTDCGQSWLVVNDDRMATEADLAAVLAAMDPERRARVIGRYLPEGAAVAHRLLELTERVVKRDAEALAAERAKVAGLKHAIDDMGATLAKVEAERDEMRAFFAEHGERLTDRVECFGGDERDFDCADCDLEYALSALLAALPKGTKET